MPNQPDEQVRLGEDDHRARRERQGCGRGQRRRAQRHHQRDGWCGQQLHGRDGRRGRHQHPEHEGGHQRPAWIGVSLFPRSEPECDWRLHDSRHARPGYESAARQRAQNVRCDLRRPDQEEHNLHLHLVRALERQTAALNRADRADRAGAAGRFQPVAAQWPSARHLQPFRVVARCHRPRGAPRLRQQHDSSVHDRPGRVEDVERDPAAERARQRGQPARYRDRHRRLLESVAARRREHHRQLEDLRALRSLQGEPLSAEPDRGRLLSALGQQSVRPEYRRRLGLGRLEQEHGERARQLLQHDRRVLQPVAPARRHGPARLLVAVVVLVALQQRLRVLSRPRCHVRHRDEHEQPPRTSGERVVPAPGRVDRVCADEPVRGPPRHEMGRRDSRLLRRGRALPADQPRL